MRTRQYIFIFLTGCLLLQGGWLPAQEYLDLWRNPNTDNFFLIQQKFNEYFANRDKGRGTGYKQFKRWEYFMEPRVYPSGKLINPAKLALDEELRYRGRTGGNLLKTEQHTGNWQSLGITSYQTTTGWAGGMGRVNCIVPHPTDPQTLFIGTPAGGIWKTTDNGNSWTSLSDGIPVIGVSGIAVNPAHPDSIYILSGDGDGHDTWSTGVFLSVNGGDTWQSTGLQWDVSTKMRGYKLLIHPTNRNILFAVTNTGIYKTTDGGVSWSVKQSECFTDMAFRPGNPSILYAVTDNTFYTSADTGENWSASVTGLPTSPNSDRIAIGVSPANSNYVYLLFGSPTGLLGLYRSVNGGQSFTLRSDSPNILGAEIMTPFDTHSQSWYDLAIAVSPGNAEEVHAGGINCWKSIDGGATWQYTSYWTQSNPDAGNGKYTHADIHALVFNGNTLYCGSDGGVYLSNNNAANWIDKSSGLVITQFYSISSPADDMDIVYGGAQDVGVNKWTAPDQVMYEQIGADGVKCVMDLIDEDIAYSFTQNGETLYVTEDGGATAWSEYNKPSGARGKFVVPLIIDPNAPTTLYAGYDAVYRIENLGKTFTPVSPSNLPYVALGMSIASTFMYAATTETLYRSVNIDVPVPAWSDITGTLPVSAAQITDVAVSAANAGKVWVTFSGYSTWNKVYLTSDAGTTWTNISGTLPNVPVNCIVYDDDGNEGIYIGTDIGVFYRDNNMTDWIPFRNGMPNVIVRDLEIAGYKIRAATFGRGIWESELYGNCNFTYTLSGADASGYQFYEASDAITSTANINGGIGTNIQYKAGNKITLNPGFKVAPQSRFTASIGNCDGTHAYQNRYSGTYEGVMSGALGIASVSDSSIALPANRLKVYPNPFSRQSTIEFYLTNYSAVTISLWDMSGKKIKVLLTSSSQPPGNYQVKLNAAGLRNGGYLVRLQTQDYQETKKIIIAQ